MYTHIHICLTSHKKKHTYRKDSKGAGNKERGGRGREGHDPSLEYLFIQI